MRSRLYPYRCDWLRFASAITSSKTYQNRSANNQWKMEIEMALEYDRLRKWSANANIPADANGINRKYWLVCDMKFPWITRIDETILLGVFVRSRMCLCSFVSYPTHPPHVYMYRVTAIRINSSNNTFGTSDWPVFGMAKLKMHGTRWMVCGCVCATTVAQNHNCWPMRVKLRITAHKRTQIVKREIKC